MKTLLFSIVTLVSVNASAATAYLKLECKSLNKSAVVDIVMSADCDSNFNISGNRTVKMATTCESQDTKFVFTEAATSGSVIVSGNNGIQTAHLVSSGTIEITPKGKYTLLLKFPAKLTFQNWLEGTKIVEITDVNCTGESFDNP